MKISEVLEAKATARAVTITPEATVRELLALLAEHNIGAVVVSNDGSAVEGIVSERDVVRRLVDNESVLDTAVGEIMTADVASAAPDDELPALMRVMTDRRIRHLPVLADDKLVGVISIGDVVKHRIDQLEEERDHLESYVHQT